MTLRIPPVAANLALLGGSLAVAFGAAELLLRLEPGLLSEEARLRLNWQAQRLSHAARTRRDSAIGFLYVPGGHGEVRQGEVHFSYTTDLEGFRNIDSAADTAEIVVVGDSWTFGFGVDDSVAWPRLLSDSLRPVRVRNLELIGASPGQYTLVLERFGLSLHPRVILYGVFPGNDLDDQSAFDRWTRTGRRGNYAEWRTYGPRGRSQPFWNRSYLLVVLQEGWKYRDARFAGSTIHLADGSPIQLAPGRLFPTAERSHRGDSTFDHVLEAVERAHALAAQANARLEVLVFPTKEEIYLPFDGKPTPQLTSRWVTALRGLGVDVLDLTGALREHAGGSPLFYEVDGHVNPAGHRVIVEAVMQYLRRRRGEFGLSLAR
jgi:acetyltransferase AlgX (SGNH hydrolase-like protein)